ncbi:MAG TPA: FAD/NAD(P)-binding protein [Candidatus Baltobacteraceae bacterium]|nr:FAD/NAD(P)-binding protein [Candidatus Baltobacteraceae bacterium]
MNVAIVGGGASGCALAVALGGRVAPNVRATIFNPGDLGPGAAYAPQSASLLMNGPVRAMSIVAGDKEHLKRWLVDETDDTLICRARYGAYLRATGAAAIATHGNIAHVRRSIVDIERDGDGFALTDDAGERHPARSVVLAMGNFPPADWFLPPALREFAGYAGDPWSMDVSHLDDRDAVLIGSRLTAMDTIALLDERAFRGNVHIVSRHGMLACLEDPRVEGADPNALDLDTSSPYTLVRSMRRAARAYDGDWRAVVESIRSRIPAIWHGWSLRERRRFLRHAQSAWAVHRYRVPAATFAAFARLRDEGRIFVHRGRILDAQANGQTVRVRVGGARIPVDIEAAYVINCTGPNEDIAKNRDPLVRNLLRRGLIRPGALRLGIDADETLRVVDGNAKAIPNLFVMGPLVRGLWYETTAIPEIVKHAASLTDSLLDSFA